MLNDPFRNIKAITDEEIRHVEAEIADLEAQATKIQVSSSSELLQAIELQIVKIRMDGAKSTLHLLMQRRDMLETMD